MVKGSGYRVGFDKNLAIEGEGTITLEEFWRLRHEQEGREREASEADEGAVVAAGDQQFHPWSSSAADASG